MSTTYDEECETLSYFLTLVMSEVNPAINKAQSYEILLQMIAEILSVQGLSEAAALRYGKKIKATEGHKGKGLH